MALPSRPIDEPELCFGCPTYWNYSMVLREQGISKVEGERVVLVYLWKTYVFRTTDGRHELIIDNLLILKRGQEKARFCM